MTIEDFTMYVVLGLPGPWPPSAPLPLLHRTEQDGRFVAVVGYPDGHLEVSVGRPPNTPPAAIMHFQRVGVTGPNLLLLTITCGEERLRAWINGSELLTLAASGGKVFPIPERPPVDPQASYRQPDAEQACGPAVLERADRFATRKAFRPRVPSRSKTPTEQEAELREAVEALRHLHASALMGGPHLVPALASQLRGLVYWPPRSKDSPNWNPLLLRLANASGRPLPVFALAERGSEPGILNSASFHAKNLQPSCRRRFPRDELMDLETYLSLPVLRVTAPEGDRSATVAGILAATANSMGSAHYDETVPLYLDDFEAQVFLGRTLVHVLILGLAEVVAELAEQLLNSN